MSCGPVEPDVGLINTLSIGAVQPLCKLCNLFSLLCFLSMKNGEGLVSRRLFHQLRRRQDPMLPAAVEGCGETKSHPTGR